MFQTLGQVIHHVQDMAQPQHVRNDQHLELEKGTEIVGCLAAPVACAAYLSIKTPSAYESHTKIRGAQLLYTGYAPVYSQSDRQTFNTPRKFWHTENQTPFAGKGLAEFTNQNFVSAGTNFDASGMFAMPIKGNAIELDIKQLLTNTTLKGTLTFWGSTVRDNYTKEVINNPFASTHSIFDADLKKKEKKPVYSLNRFNYDAANALLIPRAVGYSAGMINYFFRGEIDLVPDPVNAGNVVLKNLGPEDMKGTFTLYYDAVDGNRYPIAGDAPDKTWAARTIAANGQLDNLSFIPPTSPAPKISGDYMLVFNGDMGEEKATPSYVGAVVAKKVSARYGGALYIAGLDVAGRIVTFKVDPAGLRILNGPGSDGIMHSTSIFWNTPDQLDIDPLFPIVQSFEKRALSKLSRMKQVQFKPSANGFTHETVGLVLATRVGAPESYVMQEGKLQYRGSSFIWVARSPDPTIGEFEFRTSIQLNGLKDDFLFFSRRYQPSGSQNIVTVYGSVALPLFPSATQNEYNLFRNGDVLISPDGTKVSGFKILTQDSNLEFFHDTYELTLTLSAQPTALLRKVESIKARDYTPSPNNIDESTNIGPIYTGNNSYSEAHYKSIYNHTNVLRSPRTFVDYINDKLVSWREDEDYESVSEHSSDSFYDFKNNAVCPQILTEISSYTDISTNKTLRAKKVLLEEGTVEFTFKSIPRDVVERGGAMFCSNCTQTFHRRQVTTIPCSGESTVVNNRDKTLVFHSDAQDPDPIFSGFTVTRALTGRVDGAIVRNWAQEYIGNPPPTTKVFFGGQVLGSVIADASPLGEVFVANTDKSVVIYRPLRSSGMPATLDIPANIVELIAALWL